MRKIYHLPHHYRYYDIHKAYEKSPSLKREVEVLASIRVASEEITFKSCLESIEGIVKKGVIAFNKVKPMDNTPAYYPDFSKDKTLEIAEDFCRRNPGFKIIYYPFEVCTLADPQYVKLEAPYHNTLAAFNEFCILQLEKMATSSDPYFIKIDADHVFDVKILQNEIDQIAAYKRSIDAFYFTRLNLYYCPYNDELFIQKLHNVNDQFIAKIKDFGFINVSNDGLSYEVIAYGKPTLKEKFTYRKELKQFRKNRQEVQDYPVFTSIAQAEEALARGDNIPKLASPIMVEYERLKDSPQHLRNTVPGVNSVHFYFQKRVLATSYRGYKGLLSAEERERLGLRSYKEFLASAEFTELSQKFLDLTNEFFSYDNVLKIARGLNFSQQQKYIDYYRSHPGEDYQE